MASQGPLYPGTATTASVLPEDDNDWTTPGNIAADDGNEAQITAATYDANDISFRLKAQNLGFTIPADATINGIVVEIERRDFAGNARDYRVQLLDAAGALVGDNKALTATDWPGTPTIQSYGGSADAWNASPTPAMVNDVDFGVVLSATATAANTDIGVDFIRVTVHYTVPASINAESASYSLTGADAGTLAARLLDAQPASYALAGLEAGLSHGFAMNAEATSYAIAAADAGLLTTRLLNAEPATYLLTAAEAAVLVARALAVDPAVYVLTGLDATLQGPAVAFVLNAEPASLALTALDAGILAGRVLGAEPAVYILTGADAGVLADRLLAALPGAFVLTGAAAELLYQTGFALNAEPAVIVLAGFDAYLLLPERIGQGAVKAQLTSITGVEVDVQRITADVDDTMVHH